MGQAYIGLLADRDEIRFQMQAHAAAGDPELRRADSARLHGPVGGRQARQRRLGRARSVDFMAKGMLLNVVARRSSCADELLPLAARERALMSASLFFAG